MKIKTNLLSIIMLVLIILCVSIFIVPTNAKNIHKRAIKSEIYVIGQGDTLWGLGGQYCDDNHDVREWIYRIQQINKIQDCGSLMPGQKIKIEDWTSQ